jgi:cytochrome c oxidase subunit III
MYSKTEAGAVEAHGGQTATGARIGMWLFLATEILLFGGLFLLYAVYRVKFPGDFHAASQELSRFDGTLNTAILLTSSLAAVLAVFSLKEAGKPRRAMLFLGITIALGAAFLVVKGFEWAEKFRHGLYPNSARLLEHGPGETLYFGLYFSMTGLHALHVIAGISVLSAMLIFLRRGTVSTQRPAPLDNAALFWHLVDIIWIFLFPLFYLIA